MSWSCLASLGAIAWTKEVLRFPKFSLVRPRNASVVAPLPRSRPSAHTRGWISTCAGGMGHKHRHWKGLSGLLSHFGKHLEQIAFLELLQPEDTACPSGVVSSPMGEQKWDIGQQLCSAGVYGKPKLTASPQSVLHGGRGLHQAQQQRLFLGINPLWITK